jgi:hydroxymethylpyrimidine pyrophosphatase-like HAD family hydrolase
MKKNIKLFVIDFDGTALGGYEPYDRFPDGLSAFLDELHSRGILWATCTTWHPYSQEAVFKRSRLKSRPVRAIGRTAMNCGIYLDSRLYLDAEWDNEMLSMKAEFDRDYASPIRRFLSELKGINSFIEYFDYIFSVEYETSRKEITKTLSSNRTIKEKTYLLFLPDGKTCQIFPYYMSKGLALKRLQKELRISPGHTMVACDGINDLPILDKKVASFQVVPSNAHPEVKKVVKNNGGLVSSLPYSDGIVESARKLLGI